MIPLATINFVRQFIGVANIMFLSIGVDGKRNDKMIAGVGIGTTVSNFLGMSIILGYNASLDTLISHAYGDNNFQLCGDYLNRARVTMTLLFVPISLTLLMTKDILVGIGQGEEVAEYA